MNCPSMDWAGHGHAACIMWVCCDRIEIWLINISRRVAVIEDLACTEILICGVNSPARAVIINGTKIYDSNCGSFVDIGILDLLRIFGREGRAQYEQQYSCGRWFANEWKRKNICLAKREGQQVTDQSWFCFDGKVYFILNALWIKQKLGLFHYLLIASLFTNSLLIYLRISSHLTSNEPSESMFSPLLWITFAA